jgi:hypothetical protein
MSLRYTAMILMQTCNVAALKFLDHSLNVLVKFVVRMLSDQVIEVDGPAQQLGREMCT